MSSAGIAVPRVGNVPADHAVISSASIAVPSVGAEPALHAVISSAAIAVPALALPTFVVEISIEPEVFNLGILPSVLK